MKRCCSANCARCSASRARTASPSPANCPCRRASPRPREVTGRPDILAANPARKPRAPSCWSSARGSGRTSASAHPTARERTLDVPEPVETEQVIGFRFSFPLPLWNNNSGRIREAEAAADARGAGSRCDASSARTRKSSRRARRDDAPTRSSSANSTTKCCPPPRGSRTSFATATRPARSPLTDVLRARTRRLELQRQRLDALREYQLARIRHSAATSQSNPTSKTYK